MLYEFIRYSALIERPLVKHALNNELEVFVTSLISMLKSLQSQMDSDDMEGEMYQPAEMSPVVHQVQWAKQMEAKVIFAFISIMFVNNVYIYCHTLKLII